MASTDVSLLALANTMLELFDEGVPAVRRSVAPPFSTEEVFAWVKTVHPPEACRHGAAKIDAVKRSWGLSPSPRECGRPDPSRPLEMYRGGCNLLDPSPFVPTEVHPSFEAWAEATSTALGEPFGVMAPGLECASWDAVDTLQTLLAPTLQRTGPRSYRFNAFLGDYRRTPFGYHLDPHQECVFQFVLHGQRRGRFWEGLILGDDDAVWVDDPNHRVEPSRSPDLDVELNPGDLVFWPSTHVHGFDADAPSMALSLVVDRTSPRAREDVIAGLEVATALGRTALPRVLDDLELDPDALLTRRASARLCFECHDDDLIVGVCGRTFIWPDHASQAAAAELLAALQTLDPCTANDVSRRFHGNNLDRDDIHGLLVTLAELGFYRLRS